jgi:DNA (cytosine-5)-methyltransferase 1
VRFNIIDAAYYNEFDPYAAQWLRNLIAAGHIAPGDVDERSIEDIHPYDLIEYTQCHFFAGIGVWSYALRLAGWSDAREVWTGSCPCQPFSAAGAGGGFADERHLWPAFYHLIDFHRPPVVLGEQVASKDANRGAKDARPWDTGRPLNQIAALAGWTTPTTRDWKDSGADIKPRADGSERYDQLPRQANLAGWRTPTCQSPNSLRGNGQDPAKRLAQGHTLNLTDEVNWLKDNPAPARLTACGEMLTGCSAGMESGGQLNPAHSRWLMGLPPEWDDCAPTVTRSTPSRRKSSSKSQCSTDPDDEL